MILLWIVLGVLAFSFLATVGGRVYVIVYCRSKWNHAFLYCELVCLALAAGWAAWAITPSAMTSISRGLLITGIALVFVSGGILSFFNFCVHVVGEMGWEKANAQRSTRLRDSSASQSPSPH
jgi:hypothetical protein